MKRKKRVVVSVMSDLVTDQRVNRVCLYLLEKDAAPYLIGRALKNSPEMLPRNYPCKRIYCFFSSGMLQYIEFHIKLFFRLLFTRGDVFLANDLDTLLPNSIITTLRMKPLVYDSHEYFTGMPTLTGRPFKQKIWHRLEALLLPTIEHAYTVNASIRDLYHAETGIQMKVVRNMPVLSKIPPPPNTIQLPPYRHILLMQGAGINPEQGYEEAVEAMKLLPDIFLLVIVGDGLIWDNLKQLSETPELTGKLLLIPKLPFEKLAPVTRQAHLGLCLTKPTCLNYQLSLPNKLFDYIHAGVPVLSSDIPEVNKVIRDFSVGTIVHEISPGAIAQKIKAVFDDPERLQTWKFNTLTAKEKLNWQAEYKVLNEIYDSLLDQE